MGIEAPTSDPEAPPPRPSAEYPRVMWDGITKPAEVTRDAEVRERLAAAARAADWPALLAALQQSPELVNAPLAPTADHPPAHWVPLHQAALSGAPADVVQQLVDLGAWRSVRDDSGQQAVDIARTAGHTHLVPLLEPRLRAVGGDGLRTTDPSQAALAVQQHFHAIIRRRASQLIERAGLWLPELEPLLELPPGTRAYFPIPGFYGGFHYRLVQLAVAEDGSSGSGGGTLLRGTAGPPGLLLMTDSWCRVVGGSGERHLVTAHGSVLFEENFA